MPMAIAVLQAIVLAACVQGAQSTHDAQAEKVAQYEILVDVNLTADISHLSDEQRQMVGTLIDAADIIDDI